MWELMQSYACIYTISDNTIKLSVHKKVTISWEKALLQPHAMVWLKLHDNETFHICIAFEKCLPHRCSVATINYAISCFIMVWASFFSFPCKFAMIWHFHYAKMAGLRTILGWLSFWLSYESSLLVSVDNYYQFSRLLWRLNRSESVL